MSLAVIVGRLLIAALFVLTALHGFMNFKEFTKTVAKYFPLPMLVAAVALSVKLLGGLAVGTGINLREGALALIVFLAIVTPLYHAFWNHPKEMPHFLKNAAIIGGLLILWSYYSPAVPTPVTA